MVIQERGVDNTSMYSLFFVQVIFTKNRFDLVEEVGIQENKLEDFYITSVGRGKLVLKHSIPHFSSCPWDNVSAKNVNNYNYLNTVY